MSSAAAALGGRHPRFGDAQRSVEAQPLPRLRARGAFIEQATGTRFTVVGATDFALYERFLRGGDITAVLRQRASAGFNTVRTFGMGVITFSDGATMHLVPSEQGDRYFSQLPSFYRTLANHGLYGELTAFAAARTTLPEAREQLAYWKRLVDALQPITNALLEAVNEADQAGNRLAVIGELPRPPRPVFASHGSNGSEQQPVRQYWDYVTFHTNGAREFFRKVGAGCMELTTTVPCVANENTRAPDQFDSRAQAFDAAAGAALLSAGSTFHSVSGRTSTLWTPTEEALARAWAAGAASVPLTCQDGTARRRDDLEGTAYLRVYQRGTDDRCIVRIRR